MKHEKGSGSQEDKLTCFTCGKRRYGECLLGTRSFFGCGKDGHKVRDCPSIGSRSNEGKHVPPSMMLQRRTAFMHSGL